MNIRLKSETFLILPAACFALVICALWFTATTRAQAKEQTITLTSSFAGKETIAPTELIEFKLSRATFANESFAVLLNKTDITNLCTVKPDSIEFLPAPFALPLGNVVFTIFRLQADGEWKEIARFSIQVVTTVSAVTSPATNANANAQDTISNDDTKRRFGFEKLLFTPSVTIGFKSQFGETHFPDTNKPARPKFLDSTLQGSIKTEMKRGSMNSTMQFDVAGSSFRKEALRFGELGERANHIDLANYLMHLEFSRTRLNSGHTSFGTNRHLINNFASRGITLTVPVGKRDEFSFAALNGTSVVGFDNFFGLDNRNHQLLSLSWAHEFLRERPGGLRIETSFLDGSLLPQTGVNQGSITDAEKSQGYGFRVIASDKKQRARFDGGFTRSRFTNPPDPLLNRGQNIVQVAEVNRHARFIDASYDILRDVAITKTKKLTLNAAFHHEQADPLFRSVGATGVQADRFNNQADISGNFDQMNFSLTHQRFNDNLANIPSILKSLTRRNAAAINAPLQSFFGKSDKPSKWLPRLGLNYDRVHQYGASIPVNGGFELDPSTVPNQLSVNRNFTAEWQFTKYRVAYRFNRSSQDNRQTGREIADLYNTVNSFTFGFNPNQRIDLSVDVNSERASNKENKRTDQTWRYGFNANLQVTKNNSLSATLSTLNAFDLGQISDNFTNEFNVQWSWRFLAGKTQYKKVQGQFFIRYASFFARAIDRSFDTNNLTKSRTLNAGINFTFF